MKYTARVEPLTRLRVNTGMKDAQKVCKSKSTTIATFENQRSNSFTTKSFNWFNSFVRANQYTLNTITGN